MNKTTFASKTKSDIKGKKIGILTDPSKTLRFLSNRRIIQQQYTKIPKEIKFKKRPLIDLLGGDFSEIITLYNELDMKWGVSIIFYLGVDTFVFSKENLSPFDLENKKTIKNSVDFKKWFENLDALIISLNVNNLNEFLFFKKTIIIQSTIPIFISTGKLMIKKLSEEIPKNIKYFERKGVARFGKKNRLMIINNLEELL